MPIKFTTTGRQAGFACGNAKGGDFAFVMCKGTLTSDEPRFHQYLEGLGTAFLWHAKMPIDALHSFLLVFHEDLTAELYINHEVVTAAEVRTKSDFTRGELVPLSDIIDVRQVTFPTITLKPTDQIVYCGKVAWKFVLYFDYHVEGTLSAEVVASDLARAYRQIHYDHLYSSVRDTPTFEALRNDGWFPFAEIVAAEYRELVAAYTDRFDFENRVKRVVDAFDAARLKRITNRWWSNPVFADKRTILDAGVAAFLTGGDGGYVQCIKTLITEPEGVLRLHYKAATGKGQGVKTPELAKHAAATGLRTSRHPEAMTLPEEFRSYLEQVVFRNFNIDTGDVTPSRNTVGHGVAKPEHYTKARALQAILILDQLRFLLD